MTRSIYLSRLLAIFLIVGLAAAPLSGLAAAGAMSTHASDMASMDMAAMDMSADMPCCPDRSAPMTCDHCPLMAICMVKTFQMPSSAGLVRIQPVTVRMPAPRSDPQTESLGQPPPPRPPRSLVRPA